MRIMGFKKLAHTIGFDPAVAISKYLGISNSTESVDELIEELNREYFFCIADHKIYRYIKQKDNSYSLSEVGVDGMRMRYAMRTYMYTSVRRERSIQMNPADIFIEHPNRLTVLNIIFDPEKPMGFFEDSFDVYSRDLISVDDDNREQRATNLSTFNSWNGWPYKPEKGDWSKLQHFLLHGAFDGNLEYYEWFIKWVAFKIQNPHKLSEIAVIFYGINFVGKSFLCEFILPKMFGMNHSLPSADLKSLEKDFNSQFANKFFVHICESNLAKINRKHVGNILKKMITSTDIEIEAKGKDSKVGKNFCSFVFTTNEFTGVPIENDLRRFAAFEFGTYYLNREDLFAAIEDEFTHGGAEAFLYHLMYEVQICDTTSLMSSLRDDVNETEIRDTKSKLQLRDIRMSAPKTEILNEIEAASDNIYKKCIRIFIESGYVNNSKVINDPDEEVYISTKDFFTGCQDKIQNFRQDERGFSIQLGRELCEMCGKEWVESTRRKINQSLVARLKYPLTGSYAYILSRSLLSQRHNQFRKRLIKPKPLEESEEILSQIMTDIEIKANKTF